MTSPDPHFDFHRLDLKNLSAGDIDAAQELVVEVGWNQVKEDWSFMIANGYAIGLFDGKQLIATALALPHGTDFAWISMVLVAKTWRRKGLATALLRHCVTKISQKGQVPVLDATEAGRPVYQPLGFEDIYALSRLRASQILSNDLGVDETGNSVVQPISEFQLDGLAAWDAKRFGAMRAALLRSLWKRSKNFARIAHYNDGSMAGYLLGRNGRNATQIGPVIATDENVAITLVANALAHLNGSLIIDVADDKQALLRFLINAGFQRERGFMRMARGRARPFDQAENTFAIAGPELG